MHTVRVRVRADNLVQPTRRSDDLGAGVHEHVVRVDEHELHSGRRGRALVHVLERGVRPDGHEKPGVSMTPCGVWIRPTCGATVLGAVQCRLRTAHRSGPYA